MVRVRGGVVDVPTEVERRCVGWSECQREVNEPADELLYEDTMNLLYPPLFITSSISTLQNPPPHVAINQTVHLDAHQTRFLGAAPATPGNHGKLPFNQFLAYIQSSTRFQPHACHSWKTSLSATVRQALGIMSVSRVVEVGGNMDCPRGAGIPPVLI